MIEKKFYSVQSLIDLKPGTMVYPYIDTKNEWSTYLAPQWGTRDQSIEKNQLLPYVRNARGASDKNIKPLLREMFPRSKVYQLNRDLFNQETEKDWVTLEVTYPNPIGMFLGEVILLMDDQGKILKEQFYSKILTLDSEIVWV